MSSDESDDDVDYWLPEEYQVESVPMPNEATIRRPIAFFLFRHVAEYMMHSFVKSMSLLNKTAKASPLWEASIEEHSREQKNTTHFVSTREH